MRLITRGDVDGLACAVFLTLVEEIESIRFAHPKDMQDGLYPVGTDDVIANLPYHPDCGMWFDHHVSELAKVEAGAKIKGKWGPAPSAARLIWEYYDDERLKPFKHFLEEVDRFDSAKLTMEDVTDPEGWILVSYTIDPRSGLGRFREYFTQMVEWVKTMTLDEILALPEVKERTEKVLADQAALLEVLGRHSRLEGPVIVTDFRDLKERPAGNRFLVYTVHPAGKVEMRIFWGKYEAAVVVAVGRSIFHEDYSVDVGRLMAEYGGGGHPGAGTCQIPRPEAEAKIAEILHRLTEGAA